MDDKELQTIHFFRGRLGELESNWSELEDEGFTISGWLGRDGEGKKSTTAAKISTHRLKGLYIDFRFFWAQQEASHFLRVQNLVRKHCTSSRAVIAALKANQTQWENANSGSKWHGLQPDEMISAVFYGSVIHEADDKQENLARVKEIFSEPTAHHILASTIWARTYPLRSLAWMISPLSKEQQIIQIPSCFV